MTPELSKLLPEALREEYEILSCVKQGEDSASYIAYDRFLQRRVFVKYGSTEMLENEARILAALSCGGIPRIYGLHNVDDKAFLFQEKIEGENLRSVLAKNGPMNQRKVLKIGIRLCSILTELWACDPPIVHRDIKLDNIILTPEGEVCLVDFGIAREYSELAARDTDIMGTPETAPPEQFGFCQTDHRSDIYALGIVLTELLTGKNSPRGIPAGLRKIVLKCTNFSPDQRYSSAAALKDALVRYAERRRLWGRWTLVGAAAMLCVILMAASDHLKTSAVPDAAVLAASEPSTYVFADAAIEEEISRILGKAPGTITEEDLESVTEIHLVGRGRAEHFSDVLIQGKFISVNGTPCAEIGSVADLGDLANMPNLTAVSLCNQQIQDLSPLAGLSIRQLALHGNRISSVEPLAQCTWLEELYLSDNPASDLSPLSNLSKLWRLDISVTNVQNLDAVSAIPGLRDLRVRNCPQLSDFSALAQMNQLNQLFISPTTDEAAAIICGMENLIGLYVWHNSSITSLEQLSGMNDLVYLFFDYSGLASLDGIEAFPSLQHLSIRNSSVTDLSPLKTAKGITMLNLCGTYADDYSVLAELPKLSEVVCFDSQENAILQVLKERTEVLLSIDPSNR